MANLDQELQALMWETRQRTLDQMAAADFRVATKSSFNDLVTTVDKNNERYLTSKLRALQPAAQIISEEGFGDAVTDPAGPLFIVDPIDGTLNFVKQRDDFAIMLAYYVDGQPKLGYIMDVMAGKLYHGGPEVGVWCNDDRLPEPANRNLRDSLVDVSASLLGAGYPGLREVVAQASSLRLYGSAGIEIVRVLKGQLGLYLSNLMPWDLAAGRALAEGLGLAVKSIDAPQVDVLSSNLVLVATKQVAAEVAALVN